jgi:hypothetical protein
MCPSGDRTDSVTDNQATFLNEAINLIDEITSKWIQYKKENLI